MDEIRSISFDGKEAKISKELIRSFQFLGDIEKELKTMISIEEDLRNLENKHGRLLLYVSQVIGILEKNKIPNLLTQDLINDFEEDKTKAHVDFPRSKMIVLFSAMQTIFCLITIYDYELVKEVDIKKKTQDDFGDLIKRFILNDKNEYYIKNIAGLDSNKTSILSPDDLYQLIVSSIRIILDKWSYDSHHYPPIFTKKIKNIESIIEKNGPIIISFKK